MPRSGAKNGNIRASVAVVIGRHWLVARLTELRRGETVPALQNIPDAVAENGRVGSPVAVIVGADEYIG